MISGYISRCYSLAIAKRHTSKHTVFGNANSRAEVCLNATRLVGYKHLKSNKREWNNCFIKNNQEILLDLVDCTLQEQPEDNLMIAFSRAWYNGSYAMDTKPIKSLELHYTIIQFLITAIITYFHENSKMIKKHRKPAMSMRRSSAIVDFTGLHAWGSWDGAVVRAPSSHQCGSSSITKLGVKCGLSLLLVLVLALRGFSLGTSVSKFQFDQESVSIL